MFNILKKNILLFFVVQGILVSTSFAAINLQRLRNVSDPGWYNETNFNMEKLSGNKNAESYSGHLRFDYLTGDYDSFIVIGGEAGTNEEEVYKENFHTHLRVSRKLSEVIAIEAFAQAERDNVLYLDARYQVGAGLSWLLMDKTYGKTDDFEGRKFTMKFGSNLLSQIENYDNQGIADANGTPFVDKNMDSNRLANYVSLSYKLSDTTFLSGTTTFDFNLDDTNDFTFKTSLNLGVKIIENISFVFGVEHNYDNDPIEDVEKKDVKIKNGISIFF